MTLKCVARLMLGAVLAIGPAVGVAAQPAPPPPAHAKNWTHPAYKIYAQTLADEVMKAHPELLSFTLHGVPPGMDKVYTMFAGSYPDRIGNPDDPDDVDVIVKGITSVDPRWGRHDAIAKFVLQMPLRDAHGTNIGLAVAAYRLKPGDKRTERDFFIAGTTLRDRLQSRIPNYAALFERAR